MATTTTLRLPSTQEFQPTTAVIDAQKTAYSNTFKIDSLSTHHRIWTHVSRIRHFLSPLKAPTEINREAIADHAERSNETLSKTFPTTTDDTLHHNGAVSSSPLHTPRDHSHQNDLLPPLLLHNSQDGSARSHQPVLGHNASVSSDRSSPVLAQAKQAGANEESVPQRMNAGDDVEYSNLDSQSTKETDTLDPTQTCGPDTASSSEIPAEGKVGLVIERDICVKIQFNRDSAIKLGDGFYMEPRAKLPGNTIEVWNEDIQPKLNADLQKLMEDMSEGKNHILWYANIYMAGVKPGNDESLLVKPIIVITCCTQKFKKKLAKRFKNLKLHYLEDFGPPIIFRYTPLRCPRLAGSTNVESSTGTSPPLPSRLQGIAIERHDKSTYCGAKLRFDVEHDNLVRQCYATFGGIICIEETMYGMATAHTFHNASYPNLSGDIESSDTDYTDSLDDASFESHSGLGKEPAGAPYSPLPSRINDMEFDCLSHWKLSYGTAYSFEGRPSRTGDNVSYTPSRFDWALFSIPNRLVLPNLNGSKLLEAIIPESKLNSGAAVILCDVNGPLDGYITDTSGSIHTGISLMDVREILLDAPITDGASGSWVVRGSFVCGYIIAVTVSGRSCFMVPMQRTFENIEAAFGQKVLFGSETETVVRMHNSRMRKSSSEHQSNKLDVAAEDVISIRIPRTPEDEDEKMPGLNLTPKTSSSPSFYNLPPPISTQQPDVEKGNGASSSNAVYWEGDHDPRRPRNWPVKNQRVTLSVIILLDCVGSLASIMPAPGLSKIMSDLNCASDFFASFVISGYALGYFGAALLVGPLSDRFGRRIVTLLSSAIFSLLNLSCGWAPNIGSLIAFRSLAGFAAGCVSSVVRLSVADLSGPHNKPFIAGAINVGNLFSSLVIGPVAGGYLVETESWRWLFWIISIVGVIIFTANLLLMRETSEYVLLKRRILRLRKETGNETLSSLNYLNPQLGSLTSIYIDVFAVFRLLWRYPVFATLTIHEAILSGYMYIIFTTLPRLYLREYSFSSGSVGLTFISVFVGTSILFPLGVSILFAFGHNFTSLPSFTVSKIKLIPCSILTFGGLTLFGWAAQKNLHWISPILGIAIFALGVGSSAATVNILSTATLRGNMKRFLALQSLIRPLFTGLLPLAGPSLFASLGYGWGSTLLGFIALSLVPSMWLSNLI